MAKKKETRQQEKDGKIVFYTQELKKSKTINEDTVKVITFIVVLIIVLICIGIMLATLSKV